MKNYDKVLKEENKVAQWFADYQDGIDTKRRFEKWCKKHGVEIEDESIIAFEWLWNNDRIK